ncbi:MULTISPECIES: NAD(P)H-quinone oxidoreductase [Rhodococcus]|uniref:NAD(P)H-quinone oxidoreductase n=1 Tax=Rhodococcus oxybenzonivorans TaxID=1990687 RepID=A0AAE5A6U3_9NOCA|nr:MULTISPECIES: NAD(P)H-quinone oxidoreductase [Rhodococcus]MDV7245769.1 NAD(P)H-quinone oxidoreductase [Rhodococcus oxybenzonivorans]MDV7265806.1 NAD(P)H-quinone oxidoreductase [Rhodococcus oxybenzonivorans]MDV7276876.1 NAD(P)H-quinone oxidoreductase [Rhodococcus oxybenzonivorans]MDV7336792.1 NAD(P)H-quinone oxidoreductase [Rhodococcus oxybenzonivorans]MDV7346670.1 NAD(P)H-quinone oxidoreductase [Rhodococcus oxybenzonivorans]
MRAIVVDDDKNMNIAQVSTPTPAAGEVLLRVAAAGINRADLMQRQGLYPPPPGITDIMGMEASGTVVAVGTAVDDFRPGDQVCALVAGGAYAEYVVVPAAQLLPIPNGLSLVDAAALPEVASTVWSTIVMDAGLKAGETLLVHGGGSGIGTHAIQVGKALGATVAVTVGSEAKAQRCRELGADIVINYREQNFATELAGQADVILDIMGGQYLPGNVDALAVGGRLVIIGMQGGFTGELNVGALIGKRARVIGLNVRNRPLTGPGSKAEIVAAVAENEWPLVAQGLVRPVISAKLPLADAERGQAMLDSQDSVGKVLLLPTEP